MYVVSESMTHFGPHVSIWANAWEAFKTFAWAKQENRPVTIRHNDRVVSWHPESGWEYLTQSCFDGTLG